MPTEILGQLKALRANVAEALLKDPRYLTLQALDKSIAEIAAVLEASGLAGPETPPAPALAGIQAPAPTVRPDPAPRKEAPVKSEAPARAEPATPKPAPVKDPATKAPSGAEGASPKAAKPAPGEAVPAEDGKPPQKKIKPVEKAVAAVAALAAGGAAVAMAVEAVAKSAKAPAEPAPPKTAEPARVAGAAGKAKDEGQDQKPGQEAPAPARPAADKASGYKAMAAKPNAPQYQPSLTVKVGKLPPKVDLRPLMTPVEDQGQTNSCVANAVAGAYEYWVKKATKSEENISRLFVYYNARWRDGSQDKDEGSVIQFAMEGLSKFGACSEQNWPFDPRLIAKKPNGEAYKLAAPNRVQDMAQVPLEPEAWKQALAEGKPIVFGCLLFDSFDECSKRGGVVPMPAPDALARGTHSGHSMCAVGYNDAEKVFIVRNSWGPKWGDGGYCYMPYSYLLNPKLNSGDCWVFVPRMALPPPRETWSDNPTPVTNNGQGVDFAIEPYSLSDYESVAVDLFKDICVPFNSVELPDFQEYVSLARLSQWSKFEQFDVSTYLASASEESEESSSDSESEELSEEESTEESSGESAVDEDAEDEAGEDEENEDAESDEDDGADEDSDEDDEAESDEDDSEDDAEGDEDNDADGDGDEDDDGNDDAEETDDDASENDSEAEDDAGDADEDGEEDQDDDAGEDDAGEDDAGDDGDDGGGDEGGEDDGGDEE